MLFSYNYIELILLNLIGFSFILTLVQKNPVYSILFLVLSFLLFSVFLLIIGIKFIAFMFLVVYVGAISILFLFVLMMLNLKYIEINFSRGYYFSGIILLILFLTIQSFFLIKLEVTNVFIVNLEYIDWLRVINYKTDLEVIGLLLYGSYYFDFAISGLILLIAMIGSISLIVNFNKKYQLEYKRLALIKLKKK